MPTAQYTALANLTLGSTASTVSFSSIVGTYRDLVLVVSPIGSAAGELRFQINGDAAGNYSSVGMWGSGSTTGSPTSSGLAFARVSFNSYVDTISGFNSIINIMDYSATDKHKTVLSRSNLAAGATEAFATRWANTAAITSLSVYISGTTLATGSTFTLYGVK